MSERKEKLVYETELLRIKCFLFSLKNHKWINDQFLFKMHVNQHNLHSVSCPKTCSTLETPLTFYFIKLCENSLRTNMTFSGHRVARVTNHNKNSKLLDNNTHGDIKTYQYRDKRNLI